MFLTRMVNGLLSSNKNNNFPPSHSDPSPSQQTKAANPKSSEAASNVKATANTKSKKKSDKNKRIDTKKSITKFFKSSPKESSRERQKPGTSKRAAANNDATTKNAKVKSGSWKRSDKSNSVLNALSTKKSKVLRKKTPNLLTLSSTPDDRPFTSTPSESNSACRPGTLYSDVLFGAVPSNLIKVKILSPKRNVGEVVQKKLTKALLKYSAVEKSDFIPTADESEKESGDNNVFPLINQLTTNKTADTISLPTSSSSPTPCSGSNKPLSSSELSSINSESTPSSVCSSVTTKSDSLEEPDVVIISEPHDTTEKSGSSITYGTFLNQHFPQSNLNSAFTSSKSDQQKSRFHIDIPPWNFIEPDSGGEGFPKFLKQYEDENYLKVEKLAMLSLNLALGNGPNQGHLKFRFN